MVGQISMASSILQGMYIATLMNRACAAFKVCNDFSVPNLTLLAVDVADCGSGEYQSSSTGQCEVCPHDTYKTRKGPGPCLPCLQGTATSGCNASDHDNPSDCTPGESPSWTCVMLRNTLNQNVDTYACGQTLRSYTVPRLIASITISAESNLCSWQWFVNGAHVQPVRHTVRYYMYVISS
jgi:hypothetical protein